MRITLVTGGARSGKSSYAQQLAVRRGGVNVTVIATAIADDDDMRQRIERHRADRPPEWQVIEAATDARQAIATARHDVVVLDCLTVLSANAMMQPRPNSRSAAERAMIREAEEIVAAARGRTGTLVVVTNEVGLSIHPPTEIGRWYADGLGRANSLIASAADSVVLMVCGIPVPIKGSVE